MGTPVSKVRSMIREEIDPSPEERTKQEERMNVLEMVVASRLDKAKQKIINGETNDQKINDGTVVEHVQQVNIALSKGTNPDLHDAVTDFLGATKDSALSGFSKIIAVGVDAVLGNSSMGQHEGTNMFIVWTDNALLRLDAYFYRWNFTSSQVITNVEGVSGVVMMKRVIDIAETNPQVLTWAISRQAQFLDKKEEADEMIEKAIAILKKVDGLQDSLRDIQTVDK